MLTFFARHTVKLDIDTPTLELLWERSLIAIHYPEMRNGKCGKHDNESLDPKDYPRRSAGVLSRLLELATSGGYVCAQYVGHSEYKVGKVLPKTPVKLLRGKWGTVNGRERRPAVLKTVKFSSFVHWAPASHTVLAVSRPQQGTFQHWPSVGDRLAALVDNRKLPVRLETLAPTQQEIMCSEFLRLPIVVQNGLPQLAHLLLPVGRTMKDVDIVGIATDGKPLFAQVTFYNLSQSSEKLGRLRSYGSAGAHLILFCNHDQCQIVNGVAVYSIQKVFDALRKSQYGAVWFRHALR